jgi:hypothetical protein
LPRVQRPNRKLEVSSLRLLRRERPLHCSKLQTSPCTALPKRESSTHGSARISGGWPKVRKKRQHGLL